MLTNIIYCAFDKNDLQPRYNAEALLSCYSLRKNCNDIHVKIFTNKPDYIKTTCEKIEGLYFDAIESIEYPKFYKSAKIRAILSAQGNTIFLDTHTIILDDITLLFEAQGFDIAGSLPPWRENKGILTKSIVLSEQNISFNTGVLFLRMDSCKSYISEWLDEYQSMYSLGGKNQDQPAFIRAMKFAKGCSIMNLPNNYNFRLCYGGFISGHVYVIHTHYLKTLNKFIKKPSTDFTVRIYNHFASINDSTKSTVLPSINQNVDIFSYPLSRSKQTDVVHNTFSTKNLLLKQFKKNIRNTLHILLKNT